MWSHDFFLVKSIIEMFCSLFDRISVPVCRLTLNKKRLSAWLKEYVNNFHCFMFVFSIHVHITWNAYIKLIRHTLIKLWKYYNYVVLIKKTLYLTFLYKANLNSFNWLTNQILVCTGMKWSRKCQIQFNILGFCWCLNGVICWAKKTDSSQTSCIICVNPCYLM